MTEPIQDLYQRLEREVRTPKRRLAVDAFLPDPAALPSAVAAPAPLPVPEMSPEEAHFFTPRDLRDEEPPPAPKPRKKVKAAATKKEAPKSLQEEIAEFMNRDRRAYAPDDDLDAAPRPAGGGETPPKDPDKPGSGGDEPR